MINTNPVDFTRLKKMLWRGTLCLQVFFLLGVWVFQPWGLKYALFGVLSGIFYLWSLIFSAEHPRHKIQFVFSLIRIVLLAYLVVKLAQARLPELTLVMCGLLSYKVVLTVEYVRQALPAFGQRGFFQAGNSQIENLKRSIKTDSVKF